MVSLLKMSSFSTPRCCICLESQDVYVSCPSCKDGKYCETCITKLVNENKHNECSICRRKEWYKQSETTLALINNKISKNKQIVSNDVSLDDHEENRIENVNQESNYINCDTVCTIIVTFTIVTIIVTIISWLFIFGISDIKINVSDDYQIICKILISFGCGLTTLIVFRVLFLCISKLCDYCNYFETNESANKLCNLVTFMILSIGTTFLGFCMTFKLCELKTDFTKNESVNYLITIIISFLSGIATYVVVYLIILLNKQLYIACVDVCGDDCAECVCNPIFMICLVISSALMIYCGWMITFDLCNVKLNVNQEHILVLEVIISYLVGFCMTILFITVISMVFYLVKRCKTNTCKVHVSNIENIEEEIV